jgi:hypothetical protein
MDCASCRMVFSFNPVSASGHDQSQAGVNWVDIRTRGNVNRGEGARDYRRARSAGYVCRQSRVCIVVVG